MTGNKKYIPTGKPFDRRTADEQRKIAQAGGKASGQARREKKLLRETLQTLLASDYDCDGVIGNGVEAISLALIGQALKGNVKAFEVIRDTVGEKPAEKVDIGTDDAMRLAYERAAAVIKGKDG